MRNKREMYAALTRGDFGNTVDQYFSLPAWESRPGDAYNYWGVRTLRPGGPCAMHVHTYAVPRFVNSLNEPYNISLMVDAIATVTLFADVYDSDTGIVVCGVECPDTTWRTAMRRPTTWTGIRAKCLLDKHLNAASREDLREVMSAHRGCVIELSALDRCIGRIPGRNAVVWEVRNY